MKIISSTCSINDLLQQQVGEEPNDLSIEIEYKDLEANELDEPDESDEPNQKKCCVDKWMAFQYAFNFSLTFFNSGISTATFTTLLTDLLGIESIFFGFSTVGVGIAVPIGLVFGLIEANSHLAKSEQFADPSPVSKKVLNKTKLTWLQSLQSALHYCSDFFNGIGDQILLAKYFNIDRATLGTRALVYSGMTLFSCVGNVRELLDTCAAFRMQNIKKQ